MIKTGTWKRIKKFYFLPQYFVAPKSSIFGWTLLTSMLTFEMECTYCPIEQVVSTASGVHKGQQKIGMSAALFCLLTIPTRQCQQLVTWLNKYRKHTVGDNPIQMKHRRGRHVTKIWDTTMWKIQTQTCDKNLRHRDVTKYLEPKSAHFPVPKLLARRLCDFCKRIINKLFHGRATFTMNKVVAKCK